MDAEKERQQEANNRRRKNTETMTRKTKQEVRIVRHRHTEKNNCEGQKTLGCREKGQRAQMIVGAELGGRG